MTATAGPTTRARIAEKFDGLRSDFVIKDATEPLTVAPTKADARKAVKGDPGNCVLACTIRRILDTDNVLVFRRVAYVKHSSRTVRKYTLGSQSASVTEAFDQSGSFPTGIPFVFTVPDAGHSVDRKTESAPLSLIPPTGRSRVGGTAGNGGHGKRGARRSPEVKARSAEAKAKTAALKRPLG